MADEKPSKVRIRWGSRSDVDSQEPCEYEFATLAELNAFLYGADEATGWMGYNQIDPNPDGSWPEEPEDEPDEVEEE